MKKKQLLGILFLSGILFSFGQIREVTIQILDSETYDPIEGVNLSIEEIDNVFGTNTFGEVTLNIPPYGYNVVVSRVGYKSQKVFVDGSRSRVKIFLISVETELDEVIVSGSRGDVNVSSTDIGKDVLSLESIREIPPLAGEVDIIKSIILLPGVSTVGEASAGLNVRGGGFDQNLILLGGGTLYNPSHLFGFFSSITPELIDNVSLYKGVVPAKFGGRTSSVLDIAYRVGNYKEWEGTLGIGMASSKVSFSGPIVRDKLALTIGGRLSYVDWMIKAANDKDINNSSANFNDISLKLDYSLNINNQLSYSLYNSNDEFNLASDTVNRWSNFSQVFKWKHYFGDKLEMEGVLTDNSYDFDILNESGINDFELTSKIRDVSAKLDLNYSASELMKINFGAEVKKYEILPGSYSTESESDEDVIVENENGVEYSLFFYNTNTITKKLEISYGLRHTTYNFLGGHSVIQYEDVFPKSVSTVIDTISYSQNEVIKSYSRLEPRMGLRYSFNPSTSLKIGFNRMNQFVQLISNTATLSPVNVWKLSDNFTAPQMVTQYSLGLFKNFRNNDFETSIEIYYKDIEDVLEYKDGAQLLLNKSIETELLTGKGKAYGIELFFKKKIGKWTGWTSYTFSRSLRLVDGAFFETRINKGEWYASNFDKPHDFTIVANRKTRRKSSFSVVFTYSTGRPITYPSAKFKYFGEEIAYFDSRNESRIPDYHRLDISYSFSLRSKVKLLQGEWTLGLFNVYGRDNAYSVFFDDVEGAPPGAYKLSILRSPIPSLSYNVKF